MYTKEKYEEVKALLADPVQTAEAVAAVGAERVAGWQKNLEEYEAAHQAEEEVAPAPDTSTPAAVPPAVPLHPDLAPPEERPEPPAPTGPPAPVTPLSPAEQAIVDKLAKLPVPQGVESENWTTPPAYTTSTNIDHSMPNASGLKRFKADTSYVSKSHSPLGEIAKSVAIDPLDGWHHAMYFEPTIEQFRVDMAPYIKAKGIVAGTTDEDLSYKIYQDVQWEKARQRAEAEDRSIVRANYSDRDKKKWVQLAGFLGDKTDTASAFAKGYASGGTLGLTSALHTDYDRQQLARHPVANLLGEFRGSMNPKSLPSQIGGFGTGLAGKNLGRLGRYALSGTIGAAGATADVYGHQKAEELGDYLHGRKPDPDAKTHLTERLLGSALVGGGLGAGGEGLAEMANWVRNRTRDPTSTFGVEVRNSEAGGAATDALVGIEPSSDVKTALAKAHGGVPGSGKSVPMGTPVEYAANEVVGPIVNQHQLERSQLGNLIDNETADMLASNPKLKERLRVSNLVDFLYTAIKKRSRPGTLNVHTGHGQELVAWNNRELTDALKHSVTPSVELAVNAPAAAARKGARVISVPEARAMGFDIEVPKIRGPQQQLHTPPGEYQQVQDEWFLTPPLERRDTLHDAIPVNTPPLNMPDHYPEDAFVVLLEPQPLNAEEMQSALKGLDLKANMASKQGSKDKVWEEAGAALRQDRDNFGPEWGDLKDRHHDLLTQSEQRGAHAGITENQNYEHMAGSSRETARGRITNYGVAPKESNEAIAALADRAGKRPELETLRGTRAYTALKTSAEPTLGITPFVRVGGLVPAAKLRADALLRNVARGPQGEALFIKGLNPEQQFLKDQPLGRSLLPATSLLSSGRGALGIRSGPLYDAATTDRNKPTSGLDLEGQRIIENYLRQP